MNSILQDLILKPHVGTKAYTPKDFKVDIDVRWCAGCGGYSILNQVQRILPTLGIAKEKMVFISGIGCSSRFPYYIDIYGFHSIHGRALAVASGLKVARPDLSVWIATGDGDCLSIGGNHMIHAARRNVDFNVLMFNNEVYSLTKGQYSPTSRPGQITKSSPLGVLDDPFNPSNLAIGSGATFVARGFDKDPKMLQYLFQRAEQHRGFSFVEIYANCVIFNEGAFDDFTRKDVREEKTVMLEHDKPLVFGNNKDKGIRMDGLTPVIIDLNESRWSIDDVLVHNEKDSNLAYILSNMTFDQTLPRPIGVFLSIETPPYDQKVEEQIKRAKEIKGESDLYELLKGDDFWEIS
ncbi:MAG: 2-oxoacid:ferredoxin oxidoreductase subunit beta [Bacteroidota bacterium]